MTVLRPNTPLSGKQGISLIAEECFMQIVTTHKNTDFDALASTIAATIYIQKRFPFFRDR